MNQPPASCYQFGPFHLYPFEHLLTHNGEAIPLPPKVFDILLLLVQNSGRLLDKDQMIRTIWPDTCVEEGNLSRYISTLRRVLGEGRNERSYIATSPKIGYRFIGSVREVSEKVCEDGADPFKAAQPDLSVRSIAVLPFKPLVAEQRNESLSFGLADALIVRLCRSGRAYVLSINEVRRYGGLDQNAAAAGRELNVNVVLDGTYHRFESRIRASARVMRISDEASLWAGQFDEQFTDLFSVLDALAERITMSLAEKFRD